MNISLRLIAEYLQDLDFHIEIMGGNITVNRLAAAIPGTSGAVCYYVGDDSSELLGIERSIIFCKPGLRLEPDKGNTVIFTNNPQLCFYYISTLFKERPKPGIHKSSVVDQGVKLGGKNITIGSFCSIEECHIGDNVVIDANVKIYKGTYIGNNVQIQSNTVIGATGIMWAWNEHGNKVPCVQTGNVIINDNVFIGSNITIVRGAFENLPTIIGKSTMIAHGTMIGHGTIIGESTHFANNVSLGGSVVAGSNCFFGSGAVVRPHIRLAENTTIGAGAVVVRDSMEAGKILIGNPARSMDTNKEKLSGIPQPFSS